MARNAAPTLADWAERRGAIVGWVRLLGAIVAVSAAGAVAWAGLAARVDAHAAELNHHDRRIRAAESAIGTLRDGQQDTRWMLYTVCVRQAQQMGIQDHGCPMPEGR